MRTLVGEIIPVVTKNMGFLLRQISLIKCFLNFLIIEIMMEATKTIVCIQFILRKCQVFDWDYDGKDQSYSC